MHSATKYLAGHSDVIIGCFIVNDKNLAERLRFIQNASGAVCGPMDSFLTLGIKLYMYECNDIAENTAQIANF